MKLELWLKRILKAYLFVLPWQTVFIFQERLLNGSKWQYGTLQFFVTEGLLWLLIFLFMFWYYKRYKQERKHKKIKATKGRLFLGSMLLFIIYTSASVLWALDPAIAQQYSLYVMEASFLFLIIVLGPLSTKEILQWFIYGSFLPAVLGIVQFITQSTFSYTSIGLSLHEVQTPGTSILQVEGRRILRAYGTLSHPNVFGGYLVMVSTAILGFVALKKNDFQKMWFVRITGVFVIAALFFTYSRSAWIALAIIVCGIIILVPRKKYNVLFSALGYAAILGVFLITMFRSHLVGRITINNIYETISIEERVSGVEESFGIIKDHIWLGVGPGNYTYAMYQNNSDRPGWEYQPVHVVFLLALAELGIVGYGLIFAIIFTFFHLFRARSTKMYVVFGVGIVAMAPLLLFDHYLYTSYIGIVLVALYLALLTRLITVHK